MLAKYFGIKKRAKNGGNREWKLRLKVEQKKIIFSDRSQIFGPDVELNPNYEYVLCFCPSLRILAKIRIKFRVLMYGSWY